MQLMSFNLVVEQKYCFLCAAKDTCAMALWFDYAEHCDRYPNGPGFTRDDEEYQLEIKSIYNALKNENSDLNKQLRELQKQGENNVK